MHVGQKDVFLIYKFVNFIFDFFLHDVFFADNTNGSSWYIIKILQMSELINRFRNERC
jgi:hypothetical protein